MIHLNLIRSRLYRWAIWARKSGELQRDVQQQYVARRSSMNRTLRCVFAYYATVSQFHDVTFSLSTC